MPALEPVVAVLLANTSEFTASLEKAKGEMAGFSADTAGIGLASGVEAEAAKIGPELEKVGTESGGRLSSALSGGLSKLGTLLGKTGLPLGPLTEGLHKSAKAAEDLEGKSGSLFSHMAGIGKVATLGLTAGFVGAAAEGLHLASNLQASSAAIAVSAGTTTEAAQQISNAFLDTAGKSEFSAQEMADAFAPVAGQLKSAQGAALDRAQAMQVMTAADELATAKQIGLGEATKAVAGAMQAYQMPAKDAADLTDTLLQVSNATGQSISATAGSFEKIRTRLGGMTPPLKEVGGLLIDLTNHGVTGRQAMSVLTGSFTNFLKPTNAVVKAQRDLAIASGNLPPQLRSLAAEYLKGNMTSAEVSKQTKGLTIAQASLWGAYKKSADAVRTSGDAQQKLGIQTLDAHGKLLPLGTIIGELHDKVKGMSAAQATATLTAMGFGANAAKLLPVVEAGSASFNKSTQEASKMGAAHAAAAKQAQTLHVEFKVLKATAEDLLTKLGAALMPVVESVAKAFARFIGYLMNHKAVLYTLAGIFGTVLVAAIGAYVASLIVAGVTSLKQFAEMAAEGAAWAAETMAHILFAVGGWAIYIATNIAAAAAATAAFIAENAATLGIVAGIALLIGAIIWMATHWKETWGFIKKIAEDVWHFLDSVWHGIVKGLDKAWQFIKTIPSKIVSAFSGALSWLEHIGEDIIHGLLNGIEAYAKLVWFFYVQLPIKILGYVADAAVWLVETGWHILKGLLNGIITGAVDVWNWFTSLPGDLLNLLAEAGTWLLDIGKKIINGLWNGLKAAWNDVTGWLSNVGGWITDLKGPPEKDAVLLHENGRLIMQGFSEGLKHGWSKHVAPTLQDMTTSLSGGLTANLGVAGSTVGRIAGSGGAAGQTIINVTNPIQIDGKTIANVVTQYQLRGARTTGNALGRYSGGSQTATATAINTNAISR